MNIIENKLQKLKSETNKRRHYNVEYSKVTIPIECSFELGEFVGAFSGDGNYCFNKKTGHHRIRIYLHKTDDLDYAILLRRLIKNLFNKDSCMYFHGNCLTISLSSRKIFDVLQLIIYFGKYKTRDFLLNDEIGDYTSCFLRGFVRGLMDTDGYVSTNGNLCIGLISKSAIDQMGEILIKENIKFKYSKREINEKMRYPLHILSISRKSTKKYLEVIGFSNPRKKRLAIERNIKCGRRDLNPH